MKAGPRRHRIEFLKPTKQTSAAGDVTFAWNHHAFRWAEIKHLRSDELLEFGQQALDVSHHIRCPWVENFTSDMQIRLGTRVFEPESEDNIEERNRWHEFLCREVK